MRLLNTPGFFFHICFSIQISLTSCVVIVKVSTIIVIMVIYSIEFRSLKRTNRENKIGGRECVCVKWFISNEWLFHNEQYHFSARFNSIKSVLISIKFGTWSGNSNNEQKHYVHLYVCPLARSLFFRPPLSITDTVEVTVECSRMKNKLRMSCGVKLKKKRHENNAQNHM